MDYNPHPLDHYLRGLKMLIATRRRRYKIRKEGTVYRVEIRSLRLPTRLFLHLPPTHRVDVMSQTGQQIGSGYSTRGHVAMLGEYSSFREARRAAREYIDDDLEGPEPL